MPVADALADAETFRLFAAGRVFSSLADDAAFARLYGTKAAYRMPRGLRSAARCAEVAAHYAFRACPSLKSEDC